MRRVTHLMKCNVLRLYEHSVGCSSEKSTDLFLTSKRIVACHSQIQHVWLATSMFFPKSKMSLGSMTPALVCGKLKMSFISFMTKSERQYSILRILLITPRLPYTSSVLLSSSESNFAGSSRPSVDDDVRGEEN